MAERKRKHWAGSPEFKLLLQRLSKVGLEGVPKEWESVEPLLGEVRNFLDLQRGKLMPSEEYRLALGMTSLLEALTETLSSTTLPTEESKPSEFHLKSHHPGLQTLYEKLPAFAQSEANLLIQGESGTGKEVIASSLHRLSKRINEPFVAVNCAAIPESLFEAELFGVAKGAATGTVARRGKIESADGGTLFLDEIGELPLSVQAKLLRVLQEKKLNRVGSDDVPREVDFRVIAATNRDLGQMVQEGKFREDLYYRINVVELRLPPLRERKQDLPELVTALLVAMCSDQGIPVKTCSDTTIQMLTGFAWPGNIRQLQNKLEGALILAGKREVLEPGDFQLEAESQTQREISLPLSEGSMGKIISFKEAKERFEKAYITRTLEQTRGNKSEAARVLGLSREGLRKALKR